MKSTFLHSSVFKRTLLILIFLMLTTISLFTGVDENVSIANLIKFDEEALLTFFKSRTPRTLAIILTASGLSVSGLIMQALSSNKFMAPSTSGTLDASLLGVLLSYILLGKQSSLIQMGFAFVFALVATIIFMIVLNRIQLRDAIYVPLVGMMYGAIISAVTNAIAYHFDALQVLSLINFGTFNRFTDFSLIYIIIIPLILAVVYAAGFSIAGMGEDFAKSLGMNYRKVTFLDNM